MSLVLQLGRIARLRLIMAMLVAFCVAELAVGFKTKSLALVADAFHYINDILALSVALVAVQLAERASAPRWLTYGWQRAQLLGGFFNATILFTLAISIFLQSVGRFVHLEPVDEPMLVVILGAIGLGFNLVCAVVAHEHHHPQHGDTTTASTTSATKEAAEGDGGSGHDGHDHGMMGVLLHILGDACNNVGVIIAGLAMRFSHSPKRFYADPAIGVVIAMVIMGSSIPLLRETTRILLDSVPPSVDWDRVHGELLLLPGVQSVHELHIRRLNQHKSMATAHVVLDDAAHASTAAVRQVQRGAVECLHRHGIHSVSVQAELRDRTAAAATPPTPAKAACGYSSCEPSCTGLGCCAPGRAASAAAAAAADTDATRRG